MRKVTFASLLIIYVALRLNAVLNSVAECVDEDEYKVGLIAREVIRGSFLPFYDLKSDAHTNGHLVLGLMAVPLFRSFGESLLSLKLLALLISSCTFVLWVAFLWRVLSFRAAVLFGILWTLAPAPLVRIGLMAQGNHPEVNLLTAGALWLFYGGTITKERRWWLWVLLGLWCGFGAWFCFSFWLTILALALFWHLNEGAFFLRREFLVFMGGFLGTGWLLIYDRVRLGSQAFRVLGEPVLSHLSPGFFSRLGLLVIRDISDSLFTGYLWLDRILYLFLAFSIGWFVWMWRKELKRALRSVVRPKRGGVLRFELFFPLYAVVYAVVYSLMDFELGPPELGFREYRYLLPLFPHLFAMASIACARGEKYGLIMLAVLALPNLPSNVSLLGLKVNPSLSLPGFTYEGAGEIVEWRFREKAGELIAQIDPTYRHQALCGAGQFVGWQMLKGQAWREPPFSSPVYFIGLGKALGFTEPGVRPSFEERQALVIGAGFIAGWNESDRVHKVEQTLLRAYRVGFGWGLAEKVSFDARLYREKVCGYPGAEWEGFGAGLYWRVVSPEARKKILNSLSEPERQSAESGYEWMGRLLSSAE